MNITCTQNDSIEFLFNDWFTEISSNILLNDEKNVGFFHFFLLWKAANILLTISTCISVLYGKRCCRFELYTSYTIIFFKRSIFDAEVFVKQCFFVCCTIKYRVARQNVCKYWVCVHPKCLIVFIERSSAAYCSKWKILSEIPKATCFEPEIS